jgi:hypothetical protein
MFALAGSVAVFHCVVYRKLSGNKSGDGKPCKQLENRIETENIKSE